MSKVEAKVFPDVLYLFWDTDGELKCANVDPLHCEDIDEHTIDLADVLNSFYGNGDICNPVKIKVYGYQDRRAEPFDIGVPGRIRSGAQIHLEDMEGNAVEILSIRSKDENFPFLGVVLDWNGESLGTRNYSATGECSDGVGSHLLVVMQKSLETIMNKHISVPEVQKGQNKEDDSGKGSVNGLEKETKAGAVEATIEDFPPDFFNH